MAPAGRRGGILVEFQPMSPDEIERTVQFLLSQQAQFAADSAAMQARFDATFENLSAKTDRLADGLIGLTGIVGQLAAAQLRTDEQLRETDQQLRETDQHLRQTDQQLRETDEHLKTVESHLNRVI